MYANGGQMNTNVFLSSTYVDLEDTRDHVFTVLKKNGHNPILFEKGGISFSPDETLEKSCYQRVEECDFYILVIGSRYGSKSNEVGQLELLNDSLGNTTYQSITKTEWEIAKKNKIPMTIYVKSEVHAEYMIFSQQEKKDSYKCVNVDNLNVFYLIDEIYNQNLNNLVIEYKKPKEITKHLLKHLSGLLGTLLKEKKKRQNASINVEGQTQYYVNCYRLYYYRKEVKNLTFGQLSRKTDIDTKKLQKVENEKKSHVTFHKISLSEMNSLESALDLEPGYLIADNSSIKSGNYCDKYRDTYLSKKKKSKKNTTLLDVNKKVVVFDFDGTLTKQYRNSTTWELLWVALGYKLSDCAHYHALFSKGEITHSEWCDITKEKFNEKSISKETLDKVAEQLQLLDGVEEYIKELFDKGIDVYILSGSIDYIIKKVLHKSLAYIKEIRANDLKFRKDGVLDEIIGTKYDFKGKATFIEIKIANRDRTLKPNEVLFVGNSCNDVHAIESGAITLLINPIKVDPYTKAWNYFENEITNINEINKYVFPEEPSLNTV